MKQSKDDLASVLHWRGKFAAEVKAAIVLRQQLADVTNERDGFRSSLNTMVVYYKNAVSAGYDRITQLGGDCDSVARMLADNPDYAHAVGLLAQSAPATANQCDGCQAGKPLENGNRHRMGREGGYPDFMSCTAKLYSPATDEQGAGSLQSDVIHQMAFEEGRPADDGDGYLFTAEEFELFIERLLSQVKP
jgi:hypothetical protein